MSSKKSGNKATIGTVKFAPMPKRKRPGRHAKKKRPTHQTFFTNGPCR